MIIQVNGRPCPDQGPGGGKGMGPVQGRGPGPDVSRDRSQKQVEGDMIQWGRGRGKRCGNHLAVKRTNVRVERKSGKAEV